MKLNAAKQSPPRLQQTPSSPPTNAGSKVTIADEAAVTSVVVLISELRSVWSWRRLVIGLSSWSSALSGHRRASGRRLLAFCALNITSLFFNEF
ncbi:hypothetical protein HN873_065938, partial [Arachis hypogaea]